MSAEFTPGTLKFLSALKKNNKRAWFQPRKAEFEEQVQAPLIHFAGLVNAMLLKAAPDYALAEPAKALNRIYRDTRFSANKAPYQTHVSMLFPDRKLGKKVGAALYFHLSADEAMIAAGMYFGETRELQAVRVHIAQNHEQLRAILAARPLKQRFGELQGESLKNCPKQFGKDHPAADLLKQKQWLLHATLPADAVVADHFMADAIKGFQLLLPLVQFLNEPLKGIASITAEACRRISD